MSMVQQSLFTWAQAQPVTDEQEAVTTVRRILAEAGLRYRCIGSWFGKSPIIVVVVDDDLRYCIAPPERTQSARHEVFAYSPPDWVGEFAGSYLTVEEAAQAIAEHMRGQGR